MNIGIPKTKKVLILAASAAGIVFIQELVNQGKSKKEIFLVIDPLRKPQNLDMLPDGVVFYYVNSNDSDSLQKITQKENANVCCVFAWYAILQKDFIDLFNGRIFNMHFGDLPYFRGAGGFSWQVLNGAEKLGAFIHQLIPKVDAGAIVCSHESKILVTEPYPQDYINLSIEVSTAVSIQFARMLHNQNVLVAKEQDEFVAEYFPKLTTLENGKIDFYCTTEEVSRFIRAFSHPYAGASFLYGRQRIHVRKAIVIKDNISRHSFCIGLIVNKSSCGLHIMLKDGVLALQDFFNSDGESVNCDSFRIGDRLFNSRDELDKALLYRP